MKHPQLVANPTNTILTTHFGMYFAKYFSVCAAQATAGFSDPLEHFLGRCPPFAWVWISRDFVDHIVFQTNCKLPRFPCDYTIEHALASPNLPRDGACR